MQVVFTQNVAKIGKRGEVKDVKEGFAMNYLFPLGLAVKYSEANKNKYQAGVVAQAKVKAKQMSDTNKIAHKLRSLMLVFTEKADDKGTFFAGVTRDKIALELQKYQIVIKAKHIQLAEPIKHAGDFKVAVEVGSGVVSEVSIKTKNT